MSKTTPPAIAGAMLIRSVQLDTSAFDVTVTFTAHSYRDACVLFRKLHEQVRGGMMIAIALPPGGKIDHDTEAAS